MLLGGYGTIYLLPTNPSHGYRMIEAEEPTKIISKLTPF